MRVSPHHLLDQAGCHVIDRERVVGVLRGDRGMEQHLPEQIAELLAEVGARTLLDGVDELGRLLDEVRHEVVVRDLLRPDTPLALAQKLLGRAAQVGVGAPAPEVAPAAAVTRPPESEAELGASLLGLVALARERGWDADRALRGTIRALEADVRAAEGDVRAAEGA